MSVTTLHIDFSLALSDYQINSHADIYIPWRKQSIAHKHGRQFIGIDLREIRTRRKGGATVGYELE